MRKVELRRCCDHRGRGGRRRKRSNDLAIIGARDGLGEQRANTSGEKAVGFHGGDDGRADEDFRPRVALARFGVGLMPQLTLKRATVEQLSQLVDRYRQLKNQVMHLRFLDLRQIVQQLHALLQLFRRPHH